MPSYAAYKARIQIGVPASTLRAYSVKINWNVDLVDITAFDQEDIGCDSGQGTYLPACKEATVAVDAVWFSEDNPFGGPRNILPGTVLNFFTVTPSTDAVGAVWTFEKLVIETVDSTIQIRDAVRYSFTGKATNKFITPAKV